MTTIKNITLAFCIIAIASGCKKNSVSAIDERFVDGALVKFGYFASRQFNPPVQLKIDNVRVSNNLTYAVSFPGGGLNMGGSNTNDYLDVTPGTRAVSISFVKIGTDIDSVVLYNGNLVFEKGIRHSVMFTDSAALKAFVINDNTGLVIPSNNTTSSFKFFNGLMNMVGTGVAVDVYLNTNTTPTFSNVAYNTVTPYANMLVGTTIIVLRAAGSLPTSTPLVSYSAAYAGGRVFNTIARGNVGLTGIRVPTVSVTTIR